MEIRGVSEDEYESFLREKEYAVVLFDAAWDVGPGLAIRPRFERAAREFADRVNFGVIDCDEQVRVAISTAVVNVPTVAYYKGGRLIATLVGGVQDVTARTRAMLDGKRIGHNDGWNIDDEGRTLFPGPEP
jgi:thioredoxin 1